MFLNPVFVVTLQLTFEGIAGVTFQLHFCLRPHWHRKQLFKLTSVPNAFKEM